jgi:hypothetical protein
MVRFVLVLALLAPVASFADEPVAAPAKKVVKKQGKTILIDTVVVDGKREVPVGLVLTRDDSIKNQLDSSVDQHVRESAR